MKWEIRQITPRGNAYITDQDGYDVANADEKHAALIAAAPDLLEALGLALESLESADFSDLPFSERVKIYKPIRAAIAKAKGE